MNERYLKIFLCAAVTVFIFTVAYHIKSKSGLDIDPAHHLHNYLSQPLLLTRFAQAETVPSQQELVIEEASIVIDAGRVLGPVNRQILGVNVPGMRSSWEPEHAYSDYAGGLWDAARSRFVEEPIDLGRQIKVGALRFPGGNGIQNYDWKATIEKNRSSYFFGVDEYMRLARELGAQPLWTLSYFTGGPDDAADLVQYLNASAIDGHPWAQKRADKGNVQPYDVRYFELGNEVDSGDRKDIKSVSPEQYGADYIRYSEAMKKVDPQVRLGAGMYYDSWNQKVMEVVREKIDFGVAHIYPTPVWGKNLENMPAEKIFAISLAIPVVQVDAELKALNALLKRYAGRDVPIFVTEFNGGFEQDKPVPYRYTLGNALVNAELIRVLMDPANNVWMAHHWNLINEYWGMIANGFTGHEDELQKSYYKRPVFFVFDLYARHFGDELVAADVVSPAYDVGQEDFYKDFISRNPVGKIDKADLLNTEWDVFPVKGIHAAQKDGSLSLVFADHTQWNYFHAVKTAEVEADTFYRLSGTIKTVELDDPNGIALEVQDARGWDKTQSAATTAKIRGNAEWQYVETIYKTLPDSHMVKVFVRRSGDRGPFQGQALVKNVRLEKFVPAVDSKVPYLSVNASRKSDGSKLYLMVLNKNLKEQQTARIDVDGFGLVTEGKSWVLNGPAINALNETKHETVKISRKEFPIAGAVFTYVFEPHSLTAIELEKID